MSLIKKACLVFLVLMQFGVKNVLASCEVSVSPSNVVIGTASVSRFTVNNTGEQLANWVRIQSPGLTAYSIAQLSAAGWYPNSSATEANFAGGYLESGTTGAFDLTLTETGEVISNMSWEALVSYDAGENFESCGSTSIQIDAAPVAPVISNVSLTVGNSSAILTWSTDITATGTINYGVTSGYGSNVTGSSGTSHSLTMSGLSASTIYHYQISVTGTGGTSNTTDATFTTSAANVTTTTTNTVTTTTTNTVTKVVEVKDTTPPSVLLTGLDKKVYIKPPEISGSISDAYGILEVEYSLDEGKNWAKISMDGERGDKKSKFTFEPDVSADGTYDVMVRGLDISGNKSAGKEISFVLDQLDPAIGPGMYQMGLLPIYPDGGGVLHIPTNLDVLVVLPEIGGSDTMVLTIGDKKYALKKESGSGLWKGVFRLENKEKRTVSAEAVDGAGNTTKRDLVKVEGENMGIAVDESGQGIKDVTITVYVYDQDKKDFKEWDGVSRGIANPVKTDDGGNFSFYLPKGRYFIKLENKDWGVVRTKIFEANGFELINPKLILGNWLHDWWWKALSGLDVWPEINIEMKRPSLSVNNSLSSLFPINDLLRDSTKVLGEEKKYLIGNSSLPMPLIGKNITYVGFFEGLSRVKSFLGKSGIESAYYADPLGKLMKSLPLWTLPTIVKVDSTGVIKEMVWGNEIFNYLTQNGK